MPISGDAELRRGNNQLERVKVVDRVDNQHAGSAKALKKRTKQLLNMIFAAKQQIHVLRTTSQLAIDAHKPAVKALELPKSLDGEPLTPQNTEYGDEEQSKNPLLGENGLRIIIDKFTSAELATAKCFEKLANPKTLLAISVNTFNIEQEQITSTLLDTKRLGKAHQRQEQNLTDKAKEVNDFIKLLRKACMNHGVIIHPLLDPYVLRNRTEYKMQDFLQTELEYEKLCLEELRSVAFMEERVFSLMRGLPVAIEKVMTPLRNECIKILDPVGNLEKIDPLTDWNVFVERHRDKFVPENVDPIQKEFPEDKEHEKFQIICQPELEIYHKLHREGSASERTRGLKSKDFLDAMKWAKEMMTPSEHGYAIRGVWYISALGNLIEFDHKDCKALSIFDLRKCKLGILAPDEMERYGYFVLEGVKQYDPSEKKSNWMKKVYKFRNKWEKAKEMHKKLAKFCNNEEIENSQSVDEVVVVEEDIAATESQVDPMSGSTLVNTE
jgi:hypothetical protein